MKDVEIIGMLKSYVQKSLVGVGALKGAPCKIQSITDGDGFHTVKFEWTDDAGTSHTSDMIVNDGSDIASITQDGATITVELSDGTSHDFIVPTVQGPKGDKGDKGDTGEGMPEGGTAGQVLVKESSTDYDMEWKSLNIPSKTSDLTNDSGFITKVVNDLVNYYLKSETYSKTEVDDIVTATKNSRFEVVATLPTTDIKTNVIYLVPKDPAQTSNVKDEYINLDGTTSGWEKIGDTEIDLSDYVTTQALNTALADYTTTADLTTLLAAKQDTLTFDDAPTENSNNPVKSGGVYSADDKIYQVMGQNSAKNFIPFDLDRIKAKNTTGTWNGNVYSVNGIDFTFNSDGTVDASGTATETASVHYYDPVGLPPFGGDRILRLTGCPSGGSGTTYKVMAYRAGAVDGNTGTAEDYGDGISLRWLNDGSGVKAFVSISVYTGAGTIDLTFKPMLRLSTDTDNTFAPYAKTNQELTAENEALTNRVKGNWSEGGKNLLPIKYSKITSYGLTWEKSNDGYIILNGTSTASPAQQSLFDATPVVITLDKGTIISLKELGIDGTKKYIFSRDTKIANVRPRIDLWSDSEKLLEVELSNNDGLYKEIDFSQYPTCTGIKATIQVSLNTTVTNAVQKIMICLKSIYDLDNTYEPYAKTNQQLTEDTTALLDNTEVNGAVNYIYPINPTNTDSAGVTWTLNSDNSISVSSGGVAPSTGTGFSYRNNNAAFLRGKTVTFKANVTGNTPTYDKLYFAVICRETESGANLVRYDLWPINGQTEVTFTIPDNTNYLLIGCNIQNGATTAIDCKISPIVSLASYNGDYVPYAKSNKELTELTSQLALNVISGNSGNVFDISCNVAYGRALVITPYSIGCLAYWSGAYHYIQIAANSVITVTASNESSTGLTLTFTGSTVNVTIMSLTNRNDIWSGTRVS